MYHVYQVSDGKLISSTIVEPGALRSGLAYVSRPKIEEKGVWNPSTLSFDVRPPRRVLGRSEFYKRIGLRKLAKIMGARGNNRVATYLEYVRGLEVIDLDDPETQTELNYMKVQGFLSASDVTEILA